LIATVGADVVAAMSDDEVINEATQRLP